MAMKKRPKLPSMFDPTKSMKIETCSRCRLPRELYKRGACGPCFAIMGLFHQPRK